MDTLTGSQTIETSSVVNSMAQNPPQFGRSLIQSFLTSLRARDSNPGSASRCLFGQSDPELTRRLARQQRKEHGEQMKAKYNFDFENECPLKGQYMWEKENNVQDLPALYQQLTVKTPLLDHKDIGALALLSERNTALMTSDNDVTTSNTHCSVQSQSALTVGNSCIETVKQCVASQSSQPSLANVKCSPKSNLRKMTSSAKQDVTSRRKRKQSEITDYFSAKKSKHQNLEAKSHSNS